MAHASWNQVVVAEADRANCESVEGNVYFPPAAIKDTYFRPSQTHTVCPWKGIASYYDIVVNGEVNKDAAWYYPEPKEAAQQITGYVAFWHGVKVEE
ncbi:MAG: DUF427 domain-containing protein [Herpetosiphonaceae bacterium]|nr:DUF427 domain-containing protein [Herpetosiphonaceae bacterium]